jgi:hypothetical protein
MALRATSENIALGKSLRPGLVSPSKFYTLSHQMFGHIHGVLNVDKK